MIKLFPYQEEGVQWLATKKVALLADEMGLGKTPQAIKACDLVGAQSVLVVCPAIARINWQREFDKFSDSDIPLIHVTSYEGAAKINSTLPDVSYDVLIIDEAHYLKSTETKRTATLYGKNGLCRRAKQVWALTGTPAPNHYGELWTHLFTFGATKLSYNQFINEFCYVKKGDYGLQITGNRRDKVPELQKILSTVMLRRKKEDVMKQLPPISFSHVLVERGEVDITLSDSFIAYARNPEDLKKKLEQENAMVEYVLKNEGPTYGLRALEALASSVSTLRRYTGLQKLHPVADIIFDELENNAYEKIVIFALHRDVIEGLRQRLEKFGALTLYGGQDDLKKQRNMDAFQKDPKKRVMIANITAAGTAITLTSANQVVFIEEDWVPGNNAQAVMRCHRIGQTKPVFVRVFGLAESVDERVSNSLKRKMKELTQLFDIPSPEKSEFSKLTESHHDYISSNQDSSEITKTNDDIEELLK